MTDTQEEDGTGKPAGGPPVAPRGAPWRGRPLGTRQRDPDAPRTWLDRVSEGVAGGYSAPPADPSPPAPETAPPGPSSPGRSLLTLAVAVAAIVLLAATAHRLSLLAIIGVVVAVVLLHEAGHFTAAKLSGMKVTEFFFGFGPRIWSVRRGETEYGIKAIPAGGYCRIVGMNNLEQVDPADEPRTYRQASFWRRFAVAVAGSTVHFTLALLAVWALFAFGQQRPVPGVKTIIQASVTTPAQQAGFKAGDRILSYDGHPASDWNPMHASIQARVGVPITFVVDRHGQRLTLTAKPADESTVRDASGAPIATSHVGFLGIAPLTSNYSITSSISHAGRTFWDDGIVGTLKGLGGVFSPHGLSSLGHQVASTPGSATTAQSTSRPSGVVGIVEVANQLQGWQSEASLFFLANVSVGIINLLPMLPFDGGHVVIAIYEAVRSRKGRRYRADVTKMLPYAMAMFLVLAFVIVSTTYLDIAHPISLH